MREANIVFFHNKLLLVRSSTYTTRQGYQLSPLLFSLFINDVDDEFGSGFMGAVSPPP
jgi:hypothetical protein